jgi:hypothetical protein
MQWRLDSALNTEWQSIEVHRTDELLHRTHPPMATPSVLWNRAAAGVLTALPRCAEGGVSGYMIAISDGLGEHCTHRRERPTVQS